MAVDITSLLGGSLATAVGDIIGKFKADPNKVLEAQEMISQNQALLEQKQLELQGKLQDAISNEITAASANIRAEATNGSAFSACARPMFLYIVEAILAWNYILGPLFHKGGIVLPNNVMWLFGSVMLGYTGARSWDKFIRAPGDSQIEIKAPLNLGSLKMGNRS